MIQYIFSYHKLYQYKNNSKRLANGYEMKTNKNKEFYNSVGSVQFKFYESQLIPCHQSNHIPNTPKLQTWMLIAYPNWKFTIRIIICFSHDLLQVFQINIHNTKSHDQNQATHLGLKGFLPFSCYTINSLTVWPQLIGSKSLLLTQFLFLRCSHHLKLWALSELAAMCSKSWSILVFFEANVNTQFLMHNSQSIPRQIAQYIACLFLKSSNSSPGWPQNTILDAPSSPSLETLYYG